ncbi:hypothetical protein PoB_002213400 [Plakobranchus ocellatus]|uniref:Uncharacterized protein n=1 Tax=Plakobranchus ocellatus TaxID=259542 RepID=A0AAV3ZML4_9GAST|nr:hypothetical protein PoB_002213400 [Plakobranchus ocellatus]
MQHYKVFCHCFPRRLYFRVGDGGGGGDDDDNDNDDDNNSSNSSSNKNNNNNNNNNNNDNNDNDNNNNNNANNNNNDNNNNNINIKLVRSYRSEALGERTMQCMPANFSPYMHSKSADSKPNARSICFFTGPVFWSLFGSTLCTANLKDKALQISDLAHYQLPTQLPQNFKETHRCKIALVAFEHKSSENATSHCATLFISSSPPLVPVPAAEGSRPSPE